MTDLSRNQEMKREAKVTADELLDQAAKVADKLLLKAENDEKILSLLGRIDERSLNTVDLLKTLNGKVATHEQSINALLIKEAKRDGGIEVFSRATGAIWGVGSSVIVYAIAFFLGIKK